MARKVMVVDGDLSTRIAAIRALMGAGYELALAEDPWKARAVAEVESPDLVLVGDSIVRMSGPNVIGRLFSGQETAHLPVLVVADDPETQEAADRSGARAVIPGPVSAADLVAAVAAHIDEQGAPSRAPESVLSDMDRIAAVAALRPDASEREALDRFTRLAAQMLDVPVSTISLIGANQQSFASQIGLGEPWATAPSSLDYSYCQFTITTREPLRIDDTTLHPLSRDILTTTEIGVRSYLGIPIITSDDQAIGSLCALDMRPRTWTDHEVKLLSDLADILKAHFDATRATPGRHVPA